MKMEYKAVGVSGVSEAKEEEGVVRALVSVTGLRDNVKDIIEPGAYAKSLATRKPKGIWHHNWHESVSRTESVKELMPGDPDLPKTLPNGEPWPKGAGALEVYTRFNLKTQRGREAYEDVKFFGSDQEWSIGYQVPVGGATVDSKTGIRSIKELDLYEYSPVLFGAMPVARTASVKDAQGAFAEVKELRGDEAEGFLMEMKSLLGDEAYAPVEREMQAKGDDHDKDDDENDPDWYDDESDDDDELVDEEKPDHKDAGLNFSLAQKADIVNAISALQTLLGSVQAEEEKSLPELLEDGGVDDADILEKADEFEAASILDDHKAMNDVANDILDHVEDLATKGGNLSVLSKAAEYISLQLKEFTTDVEDGDTIDMNTLNPEQKDATSGNDDEGGNNLVPIDFKSMLDALDIP